MMARYRKKPVEIEAVQYKGNTGELPYEMGVTITRSQTGGPCFLHTLEGEMRADVGDWIIKGVKGELYPCKPDIFAATYDPVE
jgi:hypothetical protein